MRSSLRPLHDLTVGTIVASVGQIARRSVPSLPPVAAQARRVLARRKDRPWLALVVVPLAIVVATVTLHLLVIVPLVALMWWWGSSETAWVWILGVLESAWGIQWAFFGLLGLSSYPRHRALVAVLWIAYALLVAGVGAVNRWRYGRRFGM